MLIRLYVGLLHDLEDAVEFLAQRSHILPNLVVGDFGVNLGRDDPFMSQHFADRFQRYALCKRNRRGKGMPALMESNSQSKQQRTGKDKT